MRFLVENGVMDFFSRAQQRNKGGAGGSGRTTAQQLPGSGSLVLLVLAYQVQHKSARKWSCRTRISQKAVSGKETLQSVCRLRQAVPEQVGWAVWQGTVCACGGTDAML